MTTPTPETALTLATLWHSLGWPLLRLLLGLAVGLLVANLLEALRWTRHLAKLAAPLARAAHLRDVAGASFSLAFVSPAAANGLLSDSHNLGELSNNELMLANLFNSLPAYLVHTPTIFLLTWPVLGMVDNFWRKTADIWPEGKRPGAGQAAQLKTWVILASIVEKETAIEAERPRVAGVYQNRLNKGMLLQADPTVIYGLGPAFSGNIRRRDLDDPNNFYNTYQRPGLPPGPICSFGTASLAAAVRPEAHNYLYFVAKFDGGEHVFSTNLNDHNKAVRQYLHNRRTGKSAAPDAR